MRAPSRAERRPPRARVEGPAPVLRSLLPACAAALLAALPASGAAPAPRDLLDTANAVRARGCDGRPAAGSALRRDARLDRAASALAAGGPLKDALRDAGYRASRAAVLEASGDPSAIERSLAQRGCDDILDAGYRDAGAASDGRVHRLVLAAPLEAPGPSDAAAVSQRVLELVNAARQQKRRCGFRRFDPVPPLRLSAALHRAAAAHAADMAARGMMEHAGGDGSSPADRAARAGYDWRTVGENVASGQSTPEQVVAEWLGSARHCANIMDADFTEMAVAVAAGAAGVFWAQAFGAPAP